MAFGHGLSPVPEEVKDTVDSYMEALSRQSSRRYKLPAVLIPKYTTGGGWHCFDIFRDSGIAFHESEQTNKELI